MSTLPTPQERALYLYAHTGNPLDLDATPCMK